MFGIITAAVGTGMNMYSSYKTGRAQKAMAEYNAKVAQQQAEAQAQATEAEMRHRQDQARKDAGSMRASYGTRGIDMEVGSPVEVMAEEAMQNAYDVQELQRQADITRETGENQASLLNAQGKQAKRASNWNIATSGIKGAGTTYGAYKDWQSYRGEE